MKAKAKKPARRVNKRPPANKPALSSVNGRWHGLRSIEMEWMNAHPEELRKCAGEYVIVEGTEIVAHGTEPAELFKIARGRGIKIPFVFFVPPALPKNVYWIGP